MVRLKVLVVALTAFATLSLRASHHRLEVAVAHADDGGDGGGGDGGDGGEGDGGEGDDGDDGDDGDEGNDPAAEAFGLEVAMEEVAYGIINLDPIDVVADAPTPAGDTVGGAVEGAAANSGVAPGAAQALGLVAKQQAQQSIAEGKTMNQVARDVAVAVATFARDLGIALTPDQMAAIAIAISDSTGQFGGA